MTPITVSLPELQNVKAVSRNWASLVTALNNKEVEKYILTRRGTPVAVMLDIDVYIELMEKAHPLPKAKESNGRDS